MTTPPKPLLTDQERAEMRAESAIAKSSAVEAIKAAKRRDEGTGAFRRALAKATRAMVTPPEPDALPA